MGGSGSPFFFWREVCRGGGGFGGACMYEKGDANIPDFSPHKILMYLQIVKYLIANP